MGRRLFVAATRQHVGKTSVSLALLSGLQKRVSKVGFIKPVGQQHVTVSCGEHGEVRVDKDVQLMKEYFDLRHIAYPDMSPVIVPRNYTKAYIDGKIALEDQKQTITSGMAAVSGASDVTLCEGTGHVGVGSIIGLSNAAVARHLDADVLLVANGGIGSAFDELEMNRAVLQQNGVRLRGVVLNKVMPEKVEMIRDYFGRAIRERWGAARSPPPRHLRPGGQGLPGLPGVQRGQCAPPARPRAACRRRAAARGRARLPTTYYLLLTTYYLGVPLLGVVPDYLLLTTYYLLLTT